MRPGTKGGWWLAGTAAVLGVAATVVFIHRADQSAFEGKSVESWARQLATGDPKARRAFRTMGAAAVPALIQAVRKKGTASHRLLAWAYPKAPSVLRRFLPRPYDAELIRNGAISALYELGTNAAPAVPVLIQASVDAELSSFEYAGIAHAALLNMGEAGVPQLVRVLQHGNPKARGKAAMYLGIVGPEAGAAALAIGPAAAAALPALRKALKLDNDYHRLRVVEALWKVGRESASTLPVLIQVLRDPQNPNRPKAAALLGDLGPDAQAALPALREVLREDFSYTRVKAEEALRRVDPTGTAATAARR